MNYKKHCSHLDSIEMKPLDEHQVDQQTSRPPLSCTSLNRWSLISVFCHLGIAFKTPISYKQYILMWTKSPNKFSNPSWLRNLDLSLIPESVQKINYLNKYSTGLYFMKITNKTHDPLLQSRWYNNIAKTCTETTLQISYKCHPVLYQPCIVSP